MQAAPNEWVVVTQGDKQVAAGIGIRVFVSPFSVVKKFPARVHKATISTQQITKEM